MELHFDHIQKSFGKFQVLKDIDFTVRSGRAMGFLGRNGAGKTTTIRTLMNVFPPDSGRFLIDGQPLSRKNIRLGYLPEERGMYPRVPILEQLVYFGRLKGMGKKEATDDALYWLDRIGLAEQAKQNLEKLSKGNQQKVQIVQSVLGNPEVLIMDEPFSGLDPVNSQVLKGVLQSFIEKGHLVIFSSHQMSYVEEFCDDVTFIKDGRIISTGSLHDLKRRFGRNKFRVRPSLEQRDTARAALEALPGFEIGEDRQSLILTDRQDRAPTDVFAAILQTGLPLELLSVYEPSLEAVFIELDALDEETREEVAV